MTDFLPAFAIGLGEFGFRLLKEGQLLGRIGHLPRLVHFEAGAQRGQLTLNLRHAGGRGFAFAAVQLFIGSRELFLQIVSLLLQLLDPARVRAFGRRGRDGGGHGRGGQLLYAILQGALFESEHFLVGLQGGNLGLRFGQLAARLFRFVFGRRSSLQIGELFLQNLILSAQRRRGFSLGAQRLQPGLQRLFLKSQTGGEFGLLSEFEVRVLERLPGCFEFGGVRGAGRKIVQLGLEGGFIQGQSIRSFHLLRDFAVGFRQGLSRSVQLFRVWSSHGFRLRLVQADFEQIVLLLQVSDFLLRLGQLTRVNGGRLHGKGFLELRFEHGLLRLQLATPVRQGRKLRLPIAGCRFGHLGRAGARGWCGVCGCVARGGSGWAGRCWSRIRRNGSRWSSRRGG